MQPSIIINLPSLALRAGNTNLVKAFAHCSIIGNLLDLLWERHWLLAASVMAIRSASIEGWPVCLRR
jgi:hypothetical protein